MEGGVRTFYNHVAICLKVSSFFTKLELACNSSRNGEGDVSLRVAVSISLSRVGYRVLSR